MKKTSTLAVRLCLLQVCLLILVVSSSAQKTRAVARDVTTLLEILAKDYYAIDDPELRYRTVQADRSNVISILNAYTTDGFKMPITKLKTINAFQWKIRAQKQKLAAWSVAPQTSPDDLIAKQTNLDTVTNKLIEKLKALEGELYTRDDGALKALCDHFASSHNALLSLVITKFIAKFEAVRNDETDLSAYGTSAPQVQKSLNLFSGGALTFSNAVDGLAKFMVKRIKEELAAQIFDRIKEQLSEPKRENDRFLELKILLPQTATLLQNVSPEQYQGIINSLKETLEKDLNHLMVNIPQLITSPKVQELIKKYPDVDLAFLGLQLINDLNRIKSPTEIVFILENSPLIAKWNTAPPRRKNFLNSVKLASLLVYGITEESSDTRRFITREVWENYRDNADFYRLFIGFLAQQDSKYYKIEFNGRKFGEAVLANATTANNWYQAFSPKISNLLAQANGIDEQLSDLKRSRDEGKKLTSDSIAHLLRSSITFLDSAMSVSDLTLQTFSNQPHLRTKSRMYVSFARSAVDIYADLGSKRYYSAITTALGIVDQLQDEGKLRLKDADLMLVKNVGEAYALFSKIDFEVNNGTVTGATLAELQTLLKSLAAVCGGCHNFGGVINLANADVTGAAMDLIKDLRNKLTSDAMMAGYFVKWHTKLVEDAFKAEGFNLVSYTQLPPSPATLQAHLNELLYTRLPSYLVQTTRNPDIIKVVNFLVAVSKAQNAEDFSKAIEAIALPAGSAIIKRESASNISLNGYAGFYGGIERIYKKNSNAGSVAFSVPIGVAFSRSFGNICERPSVDCPNTGSWTVFLSAIDIGAFTAVRFKDSDAALPEIKFKNIFAPGVHLIYGIPKSSFSIGVGAQYGPFLRKVDVSNGSTTTTTTTTTTLPSDPEKPNSTTTTTSINAVTNDVQEQNAAIRFGLSILIDIPLINFHTKSKSFRK